MASATANMTDHDPYACDCPCHDDCKHARLREEAERERLEMEEFERRRRMQLMRMQQQLYDSKTPPKGLIMVRIPTAMLQRFINSICSRKSVLKVYGGKTFCYAKDFKSIGGSGWEDGFSLGMIKFDNFQMAKRWYESDTVCNQHDWLDSADIVTVPMRHGFRKGFDYCSMGTFLIKDPEVFYEDFINKVLPDYKAAGANVVVASPAIDKFRGIWDAGYFMLCQWKSEKDFFKYYNSGPTTQTDNWLQESSCGCMTLTDVETNIPASASYKRPPICQQHPH
ncbi:uncharacterized protein LOC135495160 [Lineus longissimus]|uniref:uncharacterized protein LOC135495160 n=1 Tax=Lineus longissimus TaxID=88925 RepID=UPI002B4C8CA5